MNKTNIRTKNYILLVLLITLAGILTWGTVKLGLMVYDKREEGVRVGAQIAKMEQEYREYLDLKTMVDELEGNYAGLLSLVPPRKEVLRNIESLEEIARVTGSQQNIAITEPLPDARLARTRALPGTVTLPTGFGSAEFSIGLATSFMELLNYLEYIDNQPFLLIFRNISISAETRIGGLNTGSINARIEGTLFFLND